MLEGSDLEVMIEEDEIEVELEDTEFDLVSIDGDDLEIDIDGDSDIDDTMPEMYVFIENLIMKEQVLGVVTEDYSSLTFPAYAFRRGELTFVNHIELTADHVTRMQLLGLKVSLVRRGKSPLTFDKVEDFIAIIKTLKERDTIDYAFSDVPDGTTES